MASQSVAPLSSRSWVVALTAGLLYAGALAGALDARTFKLELDEPARPAAVRIEVLREASLAHQGIQQPVQSAQAPDIAPQRGAYAGASSTGAASPVDTHKPPPELGIETWPFTVTDEPGGAVTVLALLIDDTHTVVDARVVVASADPLSDMTVALASLRMRIEHVHPPVSAGQRRWLPVRLEKTPTEGLIP